MVGDVGIWDVLIDIVSDVRAFILMSGFDFKRLSFMRKVAALLRARTTVLLRVVLPVGAVVLYLRAVRQTWFTAGFVYPDEVDFIFDAFCPHGECLRPRLRKFHRVASNKPVNAVQVATLKTAF